MSEKPKKHFEHMLEDERKLVCVEIIAKAIRAMRDIGCDSTYIAASLNAVRKNSSALDHRFHEGCH